MVDFKLKPTSNQTELTELDAQLIYSLIKKYGDADNAFKKKTGSDLEPQHFALVSKEVDRLFADMNKYASGNVLLDPEVSHFDEVSGEKVIDSPAVYYKLTTETDFKSQFTSDLLDVSEVYKDWKGDRTWTEIKSDK